MREKENSGKNTKRLYQKPQMEQVQLVSEEAVLEACKTRTYALGVPPCKNNATGCARARARS